MGSISRTSTSCPSTAARAWEKACCCLAELAVERGYARLEWAVLDWNQPAIDFYRGLGAVAMDEWTVYRLSGEALSAAGGTV